MKREHEVRKFFRRHGWRILAIELRRHYHVTASHNGGSPVRFTFSATPSDRRAEKNFVAFLRRCARARTTSPAPTTPAPTSSHAERSIHGY
jgi:hypothetical protein